MNWQLFEARVKDAGLTPRDCGKGHWRIEGGLNEVNWYPFSKTRTIYVNKTTARVSIPNGTLERAIALARDAGHLPMVSGRAKAKRSSTRRWRIAQLEVWPICHWCQKRLTLLTATTDHLIPLARGGVDHRSNYVLACGPCNQSRGHL